MARYLSRLVEAAILFAIAIAPIATIASPKGDEAAAPRSPRGDVIAAYREAVDILKIRSASSGDEERIKALHVDFDNAKTIAIISSTTLRKVDQFWSVLETEFLPAIKKADTIGAETAFGRLTNIYIDCCKPPIPMTSVAADKLQFADNETGSGLHEAPMAKPPEETGLLGLSFPLTTMLLGLLLAFVVSLLAYFVFIRTRAKRAAAELRHGVKPLFLRDVQTKVHVNLDSKLAALRGSLTAHGKPRRENDKLYFGNYLVNGNNEIVDEIKDRFECYATIFLNDKRIATNVLQADGSRALGTPLVKGAAYDAIFNHASGFAGEVTLFGTLILGLYEPILSDREVIGIIFVGE